MDIAPVKRVLNRTFSSTMLSIYRKDKTGKIKEQIRHEFPTDI
ncbi:MAG: hypothetical protein O7D86_09410 [Proteobacteria bacterium]|nr:hypothetical protein [Pseudomonadota bacterium]